MIKGFDNETAPLSEYEEKVLAPAVVTILRGRIGNGAAITNKGISSLLTGYKAGDTRIRKVINYIRTNGLVPCLIASSDGYYVAQSEEEVSEYEESLRGREDAIRAVRLALYKQKVERYGQPFTGTLF